MYLKSLLLIACLVTVNALHANAQDFLEKRISIRVTNIPLYEALEKIEDVAGFSFSYSPDVINVKGRVTIQAINQSVREILTEIFKSRVTIKERNKYIILQKSNIPEIDSERADFDLNGYIIDNKTGKKLANVSIYESVTLASTISNQYGFYKIRLPVTKESIRLEVRKEDYIGKSIAVPGRQDTYLHIKLSPDTLQPLSNLLSTRQAQWLDSLHNKVEIPQFQVSQKPGFIIADTIPPVVQERDYEKIKRTYQKVQSQFINAFASAQQAVHTRNIPDTLYRPFQASILPFFGTNHELSGNIVNDYSLNLIAGYSLGVKKIEVGGIFNVVRGNVKGFQLAGISNVVGNDVLGFQYSNFLNLTLGNFKGVQATNVINYTGKDFKGFQIAGVGNVVVGTLDGYQFSAGYNYAYTVRSGHQIGFVNYADSTAKIPFGLFSYVRTNGYRRYEFSTDEFNYFNTAFKTGVTRFYNIFSLGFNGFQSDKPLGTIGYGFGSAQNLGRSWALNADLTGNVVIPKEKPFKNIDFGIFKLAVSIEKKLGKTFALFAGPSLNLLSGNKSGFVDSERIQGLRPVWVGGKPDNSRKTYSWIGFQAGIRFCSGM